MKIDNVRTLILSEVKYKSSYLSAMWAQKWSNINEHQL